MKKIIGLLILVSLSLVTHAQTEKQIPDTMSIKRFSQLDSGNYFFVYTESPKDSLHLGLDHSFKCPIPAPCPVCPPVLPQRFLVSLTVNPLTGQGIAVYNDGSTTPMQLTSTFIIK